MNIIYRLHITGTVKWDCKFLFHCEKNLLKYLSRLPYERLVINRTKKCKNKLVESEEVYEGEELLNFWDTHINITKIDLDVLRGYRKLFKGPYKEIV